MAKFVNILGRITGKIAGKINQAFGLRGKSPRPAARNRFTGHGGVAAGSLRERVTGQKPFSEEEKRRWRTLSSEEVQDFMENSTPLFVNSSNVVMVQYFPEVNKLLVEFKKGKAYLYSNVSFEDALSFAQAQSKGGWVWDHLRVRGSKTAHQKPYARVR